MVSLTGYGAKQVNTSIKQTQNHVKKKIAIKDSTTLVPHAGILNVVKPILEKKGIILKIIEFTDYVHPNLKLAEKELDENFYQHIPYLEDFSKEHHLNLTYIAKVHIEPMGIYSQKVKSLIN